MYKTKEDVQKRVEQHYVEAQKHGEVFGVFLEGSHNYVDTLFSETSDVDTVAVFVPTKRDMLLGNLMKRQTVEMENGEHLEVYDVRDFYNLLKKSGINLQQTLFTEYFVVNEKYQEHYDKLVEVRERLARLSESRFLMAVMGMTNKNMKYLKKNNGGEDSDLEKYEFSRKRLANVMRLKATMEKYLEGKDFSECLKSMDENELYEVRNTDKYVKDLDKTLKFAEMLDEKVVTLAKENQGREVDLKGLYLLDNLLFGVLCAKLELQ